MLGNKIQFIYHSGTGNTLLVAKEMASVFKKAGIEVIPLKMDSTKPSKIDPDITIGLAFPVAFQSTFQFVWDFIKKLPEAKGTPIFMVDTMLAFSGAIVGPLKKVLSKKGYKCIGAKEILMPHNFLRKSYEPEKDKNRIDKGIKKTREYSESLINGKTKWGRIPFLSDAFYILCCNKYVMSSINKSIGKKITVEKSKCTNCGLCAKLCPVNNISMKTFPEWGNLCEICMRCLSFCPSNAVMIPGKKFVQYKAVKAVDILTKEL